MKLETLQLDKDKVFFTSDTHFYHTNIIKYCDRPFKDSDEMNKVLVENWNRVVPKDGIVFHLGDVSLNGTNSLHDLLFSLNGDIHLIKGNHERDALRKGKIRERWATVSDILEIFIPDDEVTYNNQHLVLCHYPMITWNASHRGSWQLFGHVHGKLTGHHKCQLDVGVDLHNFTPLSYQEVKDIVTLQNMKLQN
jgi:calcineurin-like phosphoesterase family protein